MASANFINECKKGANCNRLGTIEILSSSTELNQDNKIQNFSIDSGCYVDGQIIGTVYIKKLETQLIDALDNTLENEEVNATVGATFKVEGVDTTEYVDLGNYIVEKPKDEQTDNYTSFVAYEEILNHIDDVYSTELDYENDTITIADIYDELCDNLGLTPITTTFIGSTIEVSANPFTNGEKNRDVLNAIQKVSGSFLKVDNINKTIDLVWLSSSLDYTFNTDDYSSLEGGKTVYGPINSLVITSSQLEDENVSRSDPESIAQYGEHTLTISEDYFLYNTDLRTSVIDDIWDRVKGLTYVDCKLTTYTGKPFLNIGDKIRIYKDANNYFDTYVLKHLFTYDGSFKSEIESPCLTEQEIITKQDMSLGEKLRNTQVIVNKQENTISSITSDLQTLDTTVGNNYQELNDKFNGYVPTSQYATLETSVNTIQTNTYTKTDVNSILRGTFYDENNNQIVSEIVKTTSGTFDENGMTYEKTNANTKTTINEVGVGVKKTDGSNDYILFAGYVDDNNTQYSDFRGQTIVASENMLVDHYFVIGGKSRMENYENGTGMFYIGG